MFVKPRPGYTIRDPFKKDLLPETGREVPDENLVWRRLLNDGDVVLAEPPADKS